MLKYTSNISLCTMNAEVQEFLEDNWQNVSLSNSILLGEFLTLAMGGVNRGTLGVFSHNYKSETTTGNNVDNVLSMLSIMDYGESSVAKVEFCSSFIRQLEGSRKIQETQKFRGYWSSRNLFSDLAQDRFANERTEHAVETIRSTYSRTYSYLRAEAMYDVILNPDDYGELSELWQKQSQLFIDHRLHYCNGSNIANPEASYVQLSEDIYKMSLPNYIKHWYQQLNTMCPKSLGSFVPYEIDFIAEYFNKKNLLGNRLSEFEKLHLNMWMSNLGSKSFVQEVIEEIKIKTGVTISMGNLEVGMRLMLFGDPY